MSIHIHFIIETTKMYSFYLECTHQCLAICENVSLLKEISFEPIIDHFKHQHGKLHMT